MTDVPRTMEPDLTLRLPAEDDEEEFLRAHRATSPEVPSFLHHYEEGMPLRRYLDVLAERERGIDLLPGFRHRDQLQAVSDPTFTSTQGALRHLLKGVPETFLFAFAGPRIVGRVSIKHSLNDFLEQFGGHIGYVVVPAFRRRGYATSMLRLAIQLARQRLGLTRILLTCRDDNIGSIKAIEKNGGTLENVVTDRDGITPLRRYWINTP